MTQWKVLRKQYNIKESDFISLHVPVQESYVIGKKEIEKKFIEETEEMVDLMSKRPPILN